MNYDDPKLTAYALGEHSEAMELDDAAAKIVEETALIAGVLREHYRKPKRKYGVMRYAMAAAVILLGCLVFVMSYRPRQRETVAVAPIELTVDQPVVAVQPKGTSLLRLTPQWAEVARTSSLMSANFRGIPAVDVEQLVSVVIEDASRVGMFTSLRLTPESDVVFQ